MRRSQEVSLHCRLHWRKIQTELAASIRSDVTSRLWPSFLKAGGPRLSHTLLSESAGDSYRHLVV